MNTLLKSKVDCNHLSKPTIASPTAAVTSRISKLNKPRTFDTNLRAIFSGPPKIVLMILSIVNNPSKVRLSLLIVVPFLSASSANSLNFVENLCRAVIRLYTPSCRSSKLLGGNTFFHAFATVFRIADKPLKTFLKEVIIKDRPLRSSILSINSCKGIPSLSASVLRSLNACICSSV